MPEWLVEEGIGEHRAAHADHGRIIGAKLDWPGQLAPGQIEDAILISRAAGSSRGSARFANGEEALVSRLPRDVAEGARLRLEVTRSALWERTRLKLAQARPTSAPSRPAPTLAETLSARVVRRIDDWENVWAEAHSGEIAFSGGLLTVEPTTALTTIDIDGDLPPRELALAAIPSLAGAIRRLDLAGSIVIDFPTLSAKSDRQAVDAALERALLGWRHERTAVNGFGLVQLVARRERPSLLELLQRRPDAAARLLLRRAENVAEPGILELHANSRVKAAMWSDWEAELVRRTGRQVTWRIDDALAWHAGFAQAVAR